MANHPIMVSKVQWLLHLAPLSDYELGVKSEEGLVVSYTEWGDDAWDAVLFVPGQRLLDLLRDAGLLPPKAELTTLREQFGLCLEDYHDAYLTPCLPGFDYKCQRSGLVRYFDMDPPRWAKDKSYRNHENTGYSLDEHGQYADIYPLA